MSELPAADRRLTSNLESGTWNLELWCRHECTNKTSMSFGLGIRNPESGIGNPDRGTWNLAPRTSIFLSGSARLFAVKLASPALRLLDPRRLSLRTTAAKPQPSLGGRPEKRRFWHQSLPVFRPHRNDSANRAAKPHGFVRSQNRLRERAVSCRGPHIS